MLDPTGGVGILAVPGNAVFLVLTEIALVENNGTVVLIGEDMGGDAIEKPAVVGYHQG